MLWVFETGEPLTGVNWWSATSGLPELENTVGTSAAFAGRWPDRPSISFLTCVVL